MKTNHPTPWTISYGKIIAANGLIVCSLPSRKSNDSANLIVAAPDLLSALQGLLESCGAYINIDDVTNADIAEPAAKARAAIAKAEGRAE